MKKTWALILPLAAVLLLATGCGSSPAPSAEAEQAAAIPVDLVITEKMFIAQTNDVYLNANDYIGKTIKYEGMFFSYLYEPTDGMVYTVIRYGPGCCGDDGQAGFEVVWDEESGIQKPNEDDWVEAIGVLEWYEELGFQYLRLNLKSLRVLDQRGAETVLQ